MLRIVTFSSLFPNSAQPEHGVFVEQRLLKVIATGDVSAEVVAPVPWFPSVSPRFGKYAVFARVPREELRSGVRVQHPRFPVVPKVGMSIAPHLMARAVSGAVRAAVGRTDAQLIDAHYLYPDGVAATMLGRRFGLPVVLTARGSDVNVIARGHSFPRRMILRAIASSAAVITVSRALQSELVGLGVAADRIHVLPNGVDLELFRPRDGTARESPEGGPRLLIVSHLKEGKGHRLAIDALAALPGCVLIVAGEGPLRAELEARASNAGVGDRVRFLGRVSHRELVGVYSAADALLLPSEREGMPNVVLEALACGTPVVASRVGGIPEVVRDVAAGVLLDTLSVDALVAAVRRLLANRPSRADTRRFAEQFGWGATVSAQLALWHRVAAARSEPRASELARGLLPKSRR